MSLENANPLENAIKLPQNPPPVDKVTFDELTQFNEDYPYLWNKLCPMGKQLWTRNLCHMKYKYDYESRTWNVPDDQLTRLAGTILQSKKVHFEKNPRLRLGSFAYDFDVDEKTESESESESKKPESKKPAKPRRLGNIMF